MYVIPPSSTKYVTQVTRRTTKQQNHGLIIIMSVFKSKTALIITLTAASLVSGQQLPYLAALVLPLLPLRRPLVHALIAALSLSPGALDMHWAHLAGLALSLGAYLLYHGAPWREWVQPLPEVPLPSKYLIFVYFLIFSFVSMAHNTAVHHVALLALFAMLVMYSARASATRSMRYAIWVASGLSTIFWCALQLARLLGKQHLVQEYRKQSWWFWLVLSLSSWLGVMLAHQIGVETGEDPVLRRSLVDSEGKQISDVKIFSPLSKNSKNSQEYEMIQLKEMKDIIRKSAELERHRRQSSDEHMSEGEPQHESRRNRLPPVPFDLAINTRRRVVQNKLKSQEQSPNQQSPYHKQAQPPLHKSNGLTHPQSQQSFEKAHEGQGEITNLFLLIPFTLFAPVSLQVPLYFYLIWLQSGRTPMWVFYTMLVSAFVIMFRQESVDPQPHLQVLLRCCLILVVNKNFKLVVNITRVLRSIWLRSSFVLVLGVLFWFSLLTVNIFHIAFVLIVLLFITRNSDPNSQLPSFRHRNWKYLIVLFDVFLVSRLLWQILARDAGVGQQAQIADVANLIGISYNYGLDWHYFNLIPLLVSGVLTIQYWTYSSLIYDQLSKRTLQLLPGYRTLILRALQILTIVYYKLIPWSSHAVVLVILITLEFSLTADLLLVWSLGLLLLHMVRPNQVSSYRSMYRGWSLFLKMIALQIVLRYGFEFVKFPLVFEGVRGLPWMGVLLQYQEVLGLAIRESANTYFKKVFTKFQLMMILDFIVIAIAFLVTQYYQVMIKYYELKQQQQGHQLQQGQQHAQQQPPSEPAILIYQKYIDFKLTQWLQNFNQLMLLFSKLFLKLYYPLLGTYSCLYYSYATFTYFLCTVYYYLRLNMKYYEVWVQGEVQTRVLALFARWRARNGLTEDAGGEPAAEDRDFGGEVKQLRKDINVGSNQILFDSFIALHTRLRYWLLILTMFYIILTYTSRVLLLPEAPHLLQPHLIQHCRYWLYMMGTSEDSPISIKVYMLLVGLAVVEIKCCGLLARVGRPGGRREERAQGSDGEEQVQGEEVSIREQGELLDTVRRSSGSSFSEEQFRMQSLQAIESKANQKFADIEISLRVGTNKIAERFFVILLVFLSLLENENPFSIIYLFCAWFLNYMGSRSIQGLSWTLSLLVVLQYSLIISDPSNAYLGVSALLPGQAVGSWLVDLFAVGDAQWKLYLSFGKNRSELFVLYLSLGILMMYQACFYLQEHNWLRILAKMRHRVSLGPIERKIYEHFSSIYEYALVYSPLCITTLCLGLYLMDFTLTNMVLSLASIACLFKSFLVETYTNSQPFWKSYFRILQFLIIIFMVVYCVLSAPMYQQYCNKLLCSPEEFHTKVTKTVLLLILQIGIDLISSHHFKSAIARLECTLTQTAAYYRLTIAYMQNDRKIMREFDSLEKKELIKDKLQEIGEFVADYEKDPSIRYDNTENKEEGDESWLDAVIKLLPSLIDSSLIKTPEECKAFVKSRNSTFINWLEEKTQTGTLSEQKLRNINELYVEEFQKCENIADVREKIGDIIKDPHFSTHNIPDPEPPTLQSHNSSSPPPLRRELKQTYNAMSYDNLTSMGMGSVSVVQVGVRNTGTVRKSSMLAGFDDEREILQSGVRKVTNANVIVEERASVLPRGRKSERMTRISTEVNLQQKKELLYLLILESVLSNWHYLTYMLMILEFIVNMGLLTLPFPILTFALGIVYSYQAPKNVWRLAFLSLLPTIFFKYALQVQLFSISPQVKFLLIGSNSTSILVEYFLMFFIIVQCLLLKIVGLYDQSTDEVQCMNTALIRYIINVDDQTQQNKRKVLFTLLQRSKRPSESLQQYLFSVYECKSGYDYSTLMVSFQLAILVYIFCFYDRMAIKEELTFYKMIEYNQFTTGMVVMAFIQLGFILLDRIITVLELSYGKWDVALIIKYVVLLVSLGYVHGVVLLFFPYNSGNFGTNTYVTCFYLLHILYFLISALQVKIGVNKESRGFMDRYAWYNGYFYMAYRAVPFLFEFKVFSDWTFSNTSLRLYDWIKYEEILGYLYVAKCNSLFLRGKVLGSKIEWWKKLAMGFPLLLAIIMLLFGPLILFSSLNPLSTLNEVTGGHLELSLKINRTNEYPFYINTHMTDIHFLKEKPDAELRSIIKTFELDEKSIQIVHLQSFSDQYWEISEGSYNKLIEEPSSSLYELSLRVKFERNQTGTTPVYILNKYEIPDQRVAEFKETLQGIKPFNIEAFVPTFMRLDNNNGIHFFLTERNASISFRAQESRTFRKKYWVISDGITFKMASDKYSKAIFGYSVMSFYISIILVVANYFRFLFQGSAYTIIMSDIPYADAVLSLCDGIHQARLRNDIYQEEVLYWQLIDIIRSPDLIKAITGNYLNARLETLQAAPQPITDYQGQHAERGPGFGSMAELGPFPGMKRGGRSRLDGEDEVSNEEAQWMRNQSLFKKKQ